MVACASANLHGVLNTHKPLKTQTRVDLFFKSKETTIWNCGFKLLAGCMLPSSRGGNLQAVFGYNPLNNPQKSTFSSLRILDK